MKQIYNVFLICLFFTLTQLANIGSAMSVISVLTKKKSLLNELQKLLPNLSFHDVQNADTDTQLRKSEIIIADYDLIGPYIYELNNTRWMQGTWAGIEKLLEYLNHAEQEQPPFIISRFSGQHFGTLMGEYVIGNIINFERGFFQIKDNQKVKDWNVEGRIRDHRTLHELTIGILGLGNIGGRIAANLHGLGAKVIGYGRNPVLDKEKYNYISEYHSTDSLAEFLQKCDYFINVLPNTNATKDLLSGNILENCKDREGIFINIGRGTIISEDSLLNALSKKWIAGAILDVFEEEPLRTDSPLWLQPNVLITPHIAGISRPKDIAKQFYDNLQLYEQNLPIPATVNFTKGY